MNSSLNHIFRLVWSERIGAYVAVAEVASARGKRSSGTRGSTAAQTVAGMAGALAVSAALAGGLPTSPTVTSGSATITQSGNTMTVNQSTAKLSTDWQSFNIAAGSTVRFNQPSSSSIALNRVTGSDVSAIQGTLSANGQVFLLNPNGVLFSPTAQVNVGGLVASTLAMSNEDFLAGNFRFQGMSGASVTNLGKLAATSGGSVALIAAKVVNEGSISAPKGSVALVGGNDVTLDIGGAVPIRVTRGALNALVENGGAIEADGGLVLLTAKSADQLSASTINNTGVVRAQTLATGEHGEILLLGDMTSGQLNVGGTVDASAPTAGNGGHIETSSANVTTTSGLVVNAGAKKGVGGDWLVDPYDYTIGSSAAATISSALNTGTNVTVTTQSNNASYGSAGVSSGNGDITVTSAITKSAGADATLTLRADRNISVTAPITSTSGKLGITLSSANNASGAVGGVNVGANLASNGGRILIGGGGGSATTAMANGIGFALNRGRSSDLRCHRGSLTPVS